MSVLPCGEAIQLIKDCVADDMRSMGSSMMQAAEIRACELNDSQHKLANALADVQRREREPTAFSTTKKPKPPSHPPPRPRNDDAAFGSWAEHGRNGSGETIQDVRRRIGSLCRKLQLDDRAKSLIETTPPQVADQVLCAMEASGRTGIRNMSSLVTKLIAERWSSWRAEFDSRSAQHPSIGPPVAKANLTMSASPRPRPPHTPRQPAGTPSVDWHPESVDGARHAAETIAGASGQSPVKQPIQSAQVQVRPRPRPPVSMANSASPPQTGSPLKRARVSEQ